MGRFTIALLILCGWFVVFKMFPARFELQSESADAGSSTAVPEKPLSAQEVRGKEIFMGNCARCHHAQLEKLSTCPSLAGVSKRIPAGDWIYMWVHNSQQLIADGDTYARKVWKENRMAVMDPFPSLSNAAIDDIMAWIDSYDR